MTRFNRFVLFFLLLACYSCLDHRLTNPAAPQRLRLIQVAGTTDDGSPINTTYGYDSLNRLATIQRVNGSLSLISYNNPDKLLLFYIEYMNPADRRGGKVTLYPYNLGQPGPSVVVGNQYLFASGPQGFNPNATVASLATDVALKTHFLDFTYTLDAHNHLLSYSQSVPPHSEIERSEYTYTQENITSVSQTSFSAYSGSSQAQTTSLLDYDDKPNPYLGLLDPALDPTLRFSANNVTKNTGLSGPATLTLYRYEYNQQGLPVQRVAERDGNRSVLTYAYESY